MEVADNTSNIIATFATCFGRKIGYKMHVHYLAIYSRGALNVTIGGK